jgi:hypothetical protein
MISLQSAEVAVTKRDSKSVAYENRTKNAKCGGSETKEPGPKRFSAMRRFRANAHEWGWAVATEWFALGVILGDDR